MTSELTTLRIKTERLGTVDDILEFLADIKYTYNSIYLFDFIVKDIEIRINKKYTKNKNYFGSKDLYHLEDAENYFREGYLINSNSIGFPNLMNLTLKLDTDSIILQKDKLAISKIKIQSLGFWEFIGTLNPLLQIREYLKDRHERIKDRKYRNDQEQILADLSIIEKENSIIQQRIEILKDAGYTELEIRPFVAHLIIKPIEKLNKHQDKGLIDYPEY